MKTAAKWRQTDVNAAIRLVERAGKQVGEVAFDPDGTIRVVVRTSAADEGVQTKKWVLR